MHAKSRQRSAQVEDVDIVFAVRCARTAARKHAPRGVTRNNAQNGNASTTKSPPFAQQYAGNAACEGARAFKISAIKCCVKSAMML